MEQLNEWFIAFGTLDTPVQLGVAGFVIACFTFVMHFLGVKDVIPFLYRRYKAHKLRTWELNGEDLVIRKKELEYFTELGIWLEVRKEQLAHLVKTQADEQNPATGEIQYLSTDSLAEILNKYVGMVKHPKHEKLRVMLSDKWSAASAIQKHEQFMIMSDRALEEYAEDEEKHRKNKPY